MRFQTIHLFLKEIVREMLVFLQEDCWFLLQPPSKQKLGFWRHILSKIQSKLSLFSKAPLFRRRLSQKCWFSSRIMLISPTASFKKEWGFWKLTLNKIKLRLGLFSNKSFFLKEIVGDMLLFLQENCWFLLQTPSKPSGVLENRL